ncbi:MAG: heavy metal-binding domain-containing protein [Caldilineaceae bacterium]|nr:heavy metal-binding domain-containing protein [Caldilineaceae bacterium]
MTIGREETNPTPHPSATKPRLISLDQVPDQSVELGELLTVVVVMAANVVRDIRENIRNLVGGRMSHYEQLLEAAVEAAMDDLARKAESRGYDGVVGVKLSHPHVVDGGVEVIAYGNGYRRVE